MVDLLLAVANGSSGESQTLAAVAAWHTLAAPRRPVSLPFS